MALEHIFNQSIEGFLQIGIPNSANAYRLKSGKIKFFKANPHLPVGKNPIPFGAVAVSFPYYRKHQKHVFYGEAWFYDCDGRIINEKDFNKNGL